MHVQGRRETYTEFWWGNLKERELVRTSATEEIIK